jgi:hypothetical protein
MGGWFSRQSRGLRLVALRYSYAAAHNFCCASITIISLDKPLGGNNAQTARNFLVATQSEFGICEFSPIALFRLVVDVANEGAMRTYNMNEQARLRSQHSH